MRRRALVRIVTLLLRELAFGRWSEEDPAEVLDELRGTEEMCACGRSLERRVYHGPDVVAEDGTAYWTEGKTYVTHTPEDDDHHMAYFSGIRVERVP